MRRENGIKLRDDKERADFVRRARQPDIPLRIAGRGQRGNEQTQARAVHPLDVAKIEYDFALAGSHGFLEFFVKGRRLGPPMSLPLSSKMRTPSLRLLVIFIARFLSMQ